MWKFETSLCVFVIVLLFVFLNIFLKKYKCFVCVTKIEELFQFTIKDMVRGLLQCMTDRNIGNHYSTDMHFFFKIILIFLKDIV